jgi:hypothetical protein
MKTEKPVQVSTLDQGTILDHMAPWERTFWNLIQETKDSEKTCEGREME